ncbi:transporter [Streptobacillus moniliformis]|uniref:Band 7 protein n=1 Tax=Streptobacillus moniliformis (strain ATCC 14647 / DSM 12112 / NCTC 10651 / 9901) TaxID=519441 RepID=D1AY25_STRM9|nr:prohibitin family protein [Streptobacillus moniliformis]ACZ01201.1 band 7 protein [Streptobacillus moniliformis DSM 12112]AVL42442.1 transporter [Streptobacillus moniliformis]SQA13647.1 FtsH protease regulator HflK [Streptobacillus moniliformis]
MEKIYNRINIKSSILIISSIIIIAITSTSFYTVNTGEVAIISTFGKVNKIEGEGLNFKIPFIQSKDMLEIREKIYDFTKENGGDLSLNVSTKDIQTVNIELNVQASISDPEKLYKAFRGYHEARFIRPRVREIVQATISKYTVEEFVSKRTDISKLIFEKLKDDFDVYGLNVSNISIVNHDFSDEYERAIEQKKIAEQAVEKARSEQEKLSVEAENRVKLAEYNLKEKELQAKANQIESNSLSKQLLQKMAIEKWNGELPKVQNDSSAILINDVLK